MPSVMKWAVALMAGGLIIYSGWRWAPWLLNVFFILNCFVLIIVVLLQSGKAADLAGAFGGAGSQTAFGPRGAANVLSKATTWCAVMFMACALALVLRQDKTVATGTSILENVSKSAPPKPATPAPQPAQSPATLPPAGQQNPPASQAPTQPPTQSPPPPASGQQQQPPPAPAKKP